MSRDHLASALLGKHELSTRSALLRRVFLFCILLLMLLSQLLGNGVFASSPAFAASKPQAAPAHMTFQQFLNEMKQDQQKRPAFAGPRTPVNPYTKYEHFAAASQLPPSAEPPTMQPIHATLSSAFLAGGTGVQSLDLKSSDSRLEVQVAPGSFDLSHASVSASSGNTSQKKQSATPTPTATATVTPTPSATPTTSPSPTATPHKSHVKATPTATASVTPKTTLTPTVIPTATTTPTPSSSTLSEPLTLVLTQQHGHFAGEMNQLGSYQIQILDANGQQVTGIVFRQPLTFIYHYQSWEMTALDLDPDKLFFTWYDPTESVLHPKLPISDFILPMQNNPKTHTLTVQSAIMGTGIFTSGIGDPQNQSPSTPQSPRCRAIPANCPMRCPFRLRQALTVLIHNSNFRIPVKPPMSSIVIPRLPERWAKVGHSRWEPSRLSPIPPAAPPEPMPGTSSVALMASVTAWCRIRRLPAAPSTIRNISLTSVSSRFRKTVNPVSLSGIHRGRTTSLAVRPIPCNIAAIVTACTSMNLTSTRSLLPMRAIVVTSKSSSCIISRIVAPPPATVPARPVAAGR